MTLTEEILNNPYLKPSNCTDLADIDYAIGCLRELDKKFGESNKRLLKLWNKFLTLKSKMS